MHVKPVLQVTGDCDSALIYPQVSGFVWRSERAKSSASNTERNSWVIPGASVGLGYCLSFTAAVESTDEVDFGCARKAPRTTDKAIESASGRDSCIGIMVMYDLDEATV